jgi:hypothetical protein
MTIPRITSAQAAIIAEAESATDSAHEAERSRDHAISEKLSRDRDTVEAQYGAAKERADADKTRADTGCAAAWLGFAAALANFVPFVGQCAAAVLVAVGAVVGAEGMVDAAGHDGPAADFDLRAGQDKIESERLDKVVQDSEADRDDAKDKMRRAMAFAEQYQQQEAKIEQVS